MDNKFLTAKLTLPMIEQLEAYCDWAKRDGVYYGPKKNFEKRHEKILLWLGKIREEL